MQWNVYASSSAAWRGCYRSIPVRTCRHRAGLNFIPKVNVSFGLFHRWEDRWWASLRPGGSDFSNQNLLVATQTCHKPSTPWHAPCGNYTPSAGFSSPLPKYTPQRVSLNKYSFMLSLTNLLTSYDERIFTAPFEWVMFQTHRKSVPDFLFCRCCCCCCCLI